MSRVCSADTVYCFSVLAASGPSEGYRRNGSRLHSQDFLLISFGMDIRMFEMPSVDFSVPGWVLEWVRSEEDFTRQDSLTLMRSEGPSIFPVGRKPSALGVWSICPSLHSILFPYYRLWRMNFLLDWLWIHKTTLSRHIPFCQDQIRAVWYLFMSIKLLFRNHCWIYSWDSKSAPVWDTATELSS